MPTIAFVTDFGTADSYVAEMHSAALQAVPSCTVVTATSHVPAFDVVAGALVVERLTRSAARNTAIVAVVDPGVGSSRRRLIVRSQNVWLVGPDNGVLPIRAGDSVWEIQTRRPRANVYTFDGREVFAPIGALLAAGLHPDLVGERTNTWIASAVSLRGSHHVDLEGRSTVVGQVIALDHYGNAITSIHYEDLPGGNGVIRSPSKFAGRLHSHYAELPDQGGGLWGSSGRLELARREAPSGCIVGERIEVEWRNSPSFQPF